MVEAPAKKARTEGRHLLFSSESVNEVYPEKLCEQVSDAVLDTCLKTDPRSKVDCETATKDNMVMVAGEITTQAKLDYEGVWGAHSSGSFSGKDPTKFDRSAVVAFECLPGDVLALVVGRMLGQSCGIWDFALASNSCWFIWRRVNRELAWGYNDEVNQGTNVNPHGPLEDESWCGECRRRWFAECLCEDEDW